MPDNRPSWIDSTPGIPPAVKQIVGDAEIAEAVRLREESLSLWQAGQSGLMTHEQRFLAYHYSRAQLHRQNLAIFKAEKKQARLAGEVNPERFDFQINLYSRALASHLLHLGEFKEAAKALRGIKGFEADHLRRQIKAWEKADAIPDDKTCKCEAPATDTHVDEFDNEVPANLAAPKTFRHAEYFSKRLRKLANIHLCPCGFANGHAGEDTAHLMRLQYRQAAEHNVRLAGVKGHQARAILEKYNHRGDQVHLKA
jgi:hypothetical protein